MSSCTIWLSIIRKKSSDDVSRQKAAFESGNHPHRHVRAAPPPYVPVVYLINVRQYSSFELVSTLHWFPLVAEMGQ